MSPGSSLLRYLVLKIQKATVDMPHAPHKSGYLDIRPCLFLESPAVLLFFSFTNLLSAAMPTETSAKQKSYSLTFRLAVIKSAKNSSNASAAMVCRWRNEASLVVAEKTKVYVCQVAVC